MRIKRRWLVLLFSTLLIYGLAAGQQAQPAQPAQPSQPAQPAHPDKKKPTGSLPENLVNSNQPVQIESDNLEVLRKESKIIFTGKVILKQAPTTIQCRKLTAYYEEQKQGWDVKTAVCEGDVKVTRLDTYAKCNKATFDNVNQIVTMEGSPVIYQQNQIFRGDILKYYLNDERITGTNVRFQRNPAPPPIAPKSK